MNSEQLKLLKEKGYDKSEFISSGSFNECYYVEKGGQQLAVKVFDKEQFQEETDLENFIKINSKIQSKSIVKLIENFENEYYVYLIFPYMQEDLFTSIRKQNSGETGLSEQEAIRIFVRILKAVIDLNKYGYCHRNLKPNNILLGKESEIKIQISLYTCEFKGQEFNETLGTQGYMVIFTQCKDYEAPEILGEKPRYDYKVDIWALGCILYYLLFCETVFPAPDLLKYHQAIEKYYSENNGVFNLLTTYKTKVSNEVKQKTLSLDICKLLSDLLTPGNQGLILYFIDNDQILQQEQYLNSCEEEKIDDTTTTSTFLSSNEQQQASEVISFNQGFGSLGGSNLSFNSLIQNFQQKCLNLNLIPLELIQLGTNIIGIGSYGKVYAGKLYNSNVAIKEMGLEYESCFIWEKEINFMAKNRHPKIITMYGVSFKDCGDKYVTCYIILELMKWTLDVYIKERQVGMNQKIRLLLDLAEGLYFLHSQNIVHRDLKPANILISESGELKITDLGVSKLLENKEETSTSLACNLKYSSREMKLENRTTFFADVWSFGLIAYEVLTGQRVWKDKKTQLSLYSALENKEFPFPVDPQNTGIRQDLIDLITECSSYNEKQRPSSKMVYERLLKINEVVNQ